jgi:hypothetical protein
MYLKINKLQIVIFCKRKQNRNSEQNKAIYLQTGFLGGGSLAAWL